MRKAVLRRFSHILRREQTDAEKKLWWRLRDRQFKGLKFKRQQVLGPYIVDFCSFEGKVIIELDGGQHMDRQKEDLERTKYLEARGYKVLRFWDHEALTAPDAVLERVLEILALRFECQMDQEKISPSPGASRRPLPPGERGL